MTRSAPARRWAVVVLAMSACWCGLLQAQDRVRVVTFNVRNYLAMDRVVDEGWRPTFPKPETEKAAVRAALRAIDADIVALQEIGPAAYLEELRQDLGRERLGYPHAHLLEAADPERHVAVLSRVPFQNIVEHADVSFRYFGETEQVKRGMLEVSFSSPVGNWTLFVVHLKSRYTDRDDDPMSAIRRVGEAQALRDIVLQRFPDPESARFAVVGDFNDSTDSAPVARFLRRGATTIAVMLPAGDERGETWTHRYERADLYSRVDFILVSPGLLPRVPQERGTVFDDPAVLSGSDHRPVYFDLELSATDRRQPES